MSSLFRAHGLGNDYLVWEGEAAAMDAERARRICDRHTGVGSDGVLVPGEGAEPAVRIFNPDGSEAEKSGNGVRIFALWWYRRTGRAAFTVATAGGPVGIVVREAAEGVTIRADMGPARLAPVERLCGLDTHPVDVGNPHRVVLELPDDWRARGAAIEHAVPGRTNVQFVRVIDRAQVEARIWERGAGETTASGSSASAVARVVTALGLCDAALTVRMPGGDLRVEVDPSGRVSIDGAIVPIGTFTLDPRWS